MKYWIVFCTFLPQVLPVILPYALLLLFGGGSLSTCGFLMWRLRKLQTQIAGQEDDLRSATATWANSLAAVGKQIEMIEAAKNPAPGSDANAATRRKVLKMHRLGSSVEQIARTLRLSKGDVNLLLKVHTIILRPFEQPPPDRLAAMEQKT